MTRNAMADAVNIGQKTKFTGSEIEAFSIAHSIDFSDAVQCRRCRTYAIRVRQFERICDQLARHIDRERLEAENV